MTGRAMRLLVRGAALLLLVVLLTAVACRGAPEAKPAAAPTPATAPAAPAGAASVPTPTPARPAALVATPSPATAPAPAATAPAPVAPAEARKRALLGAISQDDVKGAKYGGTVRVFLYTADPDLAPAQTNPASEEAMQGLYSKLLMWNPFNPSESIPDLAERWEVDPTGSIYTFYLRKDVNWHDGTPFTAADVVATYEYSAELWKKFGQGRRWGGFLSDVYQSSRAVDNYTLEVKLQYPFADFIALVSSSQLRIAPRHKIERFKGRTSYEPLFTGDDNPPVGTGPFKYKKWTLGVSIEAVRNDNYYRKDPFGRKLPYLDGYNGTVMVDKSLQFAAFMAGRLDVWPVFPVMTTDEKDQMVKRMGSKIRVLEGTTILHMTTWFNLQKPPTNNPDFRRAISLILDLEDMKERVDQGHGNMGYILDPVAFPDYVLPEAEMKKAQWLALSRSEALAEARRLLAKIGYPTPQDVPELLVMAQSSAPFNRRGEVTGAQLTAFGIRNRVEIYPPAVTFAKGREGAFDLWAMGLGTTVMYPLNTLDQNYMTEQDAYPPARWVTPTGETASGQKKIRAFYDKALREIDPLKRRDLIWDIQRVLYFEDTPKHPVGYPMTWVPVWSYVKGYYVGAGLYEGQARIYAWLDK
ncbi:MAG: ABC transporter substrate-binding protein [Chloroflexi bacterium]|nr:ABC transporter substrate-binding protein [Chloroflexota bacterium]